MLTLNYQVEIQSDPDMVWNMLTELELYTQWATAFRHILSSVVNGAKAPT